MQLSPFIFRCKHGKWSSIPELLVQYADFYVVQLPLGLLNAAQGHPMLVELKNGETLNGHLISCDTWMNLTLKEVVQTSPEGDKFFRLPEVYVRGNNVHQFTRRCDK